MSGGPVQSISLAVRSYSGEAELHDHDFHQVVLPQSGSMEIELDGCGGRVDWSQGVIIPAGSHHAFLAKNSNTFLVIDIGTAPVNEPYYATPPEALLNRRGFFPIGPEIRHLLDYAALNTQLLGCSSPLADPWSRLLLSSLVPSPRSAARRGQLILARALAYIENNLDASVTVRDIARATGASERHLYLLFNQEMKSTPFTYISTLRLNKAVDLLRETSIPIAEIAHRVGYADQSALTHALKKSRGVTPALVRKNSR